MLPGEFFVSTHPTGDDPRFSEIGGNFSQNPWVLRGCIGDHLLLVLPFPYSSLQSHKGAFAAGVGRPESSRGDEMVSMLCSELVCVAQLGKDQAH